MKMEFSYKNFREKYLHSAALMPNGPLNPLSIIDSVKLGKVLEDKNINKRIREAFNELENRMGGEYFSEFERVQTWAKDCAIFVFPVYKLLFMDIVCEDWLSLVDFHKGFSRDHSIHQPLTAYIVCKLLGGGKASESFEVRGVTLMDRALNVLIEGEETQYLRDRLSYYYPDSPLIKGERELWRAVFYQTAIITAMYHDLGYPWQFIERMHDNLEDDILLFGKLSKDNKEVKEYIDKHKDELLFRPFYDYGSKGKTLDENGEKLFEEFLHKSHGLMGAVAYNEYNEYYNSDNKDCLSGLIKFCQEWSCMAILMHDMKSAYEKSSGFPRLNFEKDPLSFIIALADTLEDFNRPNAKIKQNTDGRGCIIEYAFPSLDVVLEEKGGQAEIRYRMNPDTLPKQTELKAKDQDELFDREKGYFDLASVGLDQLIIKCV